LREQRFRRDHQSRRRIPKGGSSLPVEFARESGAKKNQRGHRITLVICPESARVPTYWILLDAPDLTAARKCPAIREGIPTSWETDIAFADCASSHTHGVEADTVTNWGSAIGLAGVVWTNVPCKIDVQQVMAS
jgi:hypothetical protein